MDRFNRNTFESIEFLIESSAETPKIKAGGSSSSNVLNRYFNALSQDISLLATRANVLAARSSRVELGCSNQAAALQSAFTALSASIEAASGYSQILATFHKNTYINTGTTTATIDYTFGQATLPILSSVDLLVQEDVYGNSYVSPEVTWSYSTSSATGVANLSLTDFVVDPDGIFMIKQEQTWIKECNPGQTRGWIRVKAPLQYRGLTPNVLELWPFPALGMDLYGVWYRKAGDTDGTWTAADITYLPGYSSTLGRIEKVGPIRIHLPNEPLSEILIGLGVSSVDVWGVKKIKIYHREYDSSAVLVVNDPHSRTIGDTTLRGKDPADLSTLGITKSTNTATINLTTTNSTSTPVLTGVIMAVS